VIRTNGKLAIDRMAELQERASVVERQLREVRDQLAESVGQTTETATVRKALRDFDGLWSEMTSREQEKFVKTLVERVTYNGATGQVTVGFCTAGIRQLCVEIRSNAE
jgi:site-specific DNA recombinase